MTTPEAVAWLQQQIRVKLAAARGLASYGTGHWGVVRNEDFDYTVHDTGNVLPKQDAMADIWREDAAYFIVDNDPQGVIAHCEAELAILAEHGGTIECDCGQMAPCRTVRGLASAYRHRPDYAEHWGSGD